MKFKLTFKGHDNNSVAAKSNNLIENMLGKNLKYCNKQSTNT